MPHPRLDSAAMLRRINGDLGAALGGILGEVFDLGLVFALAGHSSLALVLAAPLLSDEALAATEAEADR